MASDTIKNLGVQLGDARRTLENNSRTWQDEKAALVKKVAGLEDQLANFDENAGNCISQNKVYKIAVTDLTDQLCADRQELKLVKQQIFEKIERVIEIQKENDQLHKTVKSLQQDVTLNQEKRETMRDALAKSETQMQDELAKNEVLEEMKIKVTSLLGQMKTILEPME